MPPLLFNYFGLTSWYAVLATGVMIAVVAYIVVGAIKRHLP